MITGSSAWGHTALEWNRRSLCALPVKFRTRDNQGVGEGRRRKLHRSKSAPGRPAEFIPNLLTLLKAQIETSSGDHAPEVQSVRSDSMIYRGAFATDVVPGRLVGLEDGRGEVRSISFWMETLQLLEKRKTNWQEKLRSKKWNILSALFL